MNFFKRLVKSFRWYPLSGGSEVYGRGMLGPTRVAWNSREAEANTVIMAGLRWACTNSIEPPLAAGVMQDSEFVANPNHDASRLIASPLGRVDTSRVTTQMMLRMGVISGLFLDGNAYLLKIRSASGAVIGLDWLAHTMVTPKISADGEGIEAYAVSRLGRSNSYAPQDIVHFRWLPDFDNPYMGISPLKATMRHVLSDNQIAVFTHALLRNPAPSALLTPTDSGSQWDRVQLETLLADFKRQTAGERAGNMMGLTFPAKIERLSLSPKDMDVQVMARLSEERLSSTMGIPAVVLGLGAGLDRATFANYAEARTAAVEDFLVPLWRVIESTLTEQLLPELKQQNGLVFAHDLRGVRALQEDEDAKHARVREDFKSNLIDRAEARQSLGYKPSAGDKGIYSWMLSPNAFAGPDQSKGLRAQLEQRLADAG